ncbi:MAG: RNB domain-containing ribonuclease [bacterium]|nr:RNB domain-containing ribonuclease [bacterium]
MLKKNSLVLYKNRPARVIAPGDKTEVELENGTVKKVRPKDVEPLHPGPINSLKELLPKTGDVETAWELLAGETTELEELSELIFEEYTPASAWETFQLIDEGIYFRGTPAEVIVASAEEVTQEKAKRSARATEKQEWADFLLRLNEGKIVPGDYPRLLEVEQVARGKNVKSRVMKELAISATQENAHALLLRLGMWDELENPYPARFDISLGEPGFPLPDLPGEERLDLTHLAAYAIDDEDSQDPDDAISYDGERFWVHIADVAALVIPGSEVDINARKIASNLYLPEVKMPMLPPKATELLALGLQEISPAFSFGLVLSETGEITDVRLTPSWIKVTRLTYAGAEEQLETEAFKTIYGLAQLYQARRLENGAVTIDLPEVKIRVKEGKVKITPLKPLKSRELVAEAMFMAGEAAARFALENSIPFPFTNQDPPDAGDVPQDLAGMFGYRFKMKRSRMQSVAKPHAGLGLDVYARVTSPLRRYLDLVVHQQLRAFLKGEPLLDEQELMLRVGAAEAVLQTLNRTERFSNQHWTLVYLMQNPQWQGEGILVEHSQRRSLVLIPGLGLEVPVHLSKPPGLNARLNLGNARIDLPHLSVHFKIT